MFKLVCDGITSLPGVWRAMACQRTLWWVACFLLQEVSIQKENDEDGSLWDASRRTWDWILTRTWHQPGICLDCMPLVWSRRCCGCEAIEGVAYRPSLREVGLQVACVGMCGICKGVGIPPVAISPGKVSPCDLLEDMGNKNGFQNGQLCNIFTILVVVQVFKEWWEWQSPFIGANGNEKGWITKLPDCVDEIQILVLPVGVREWFVPQTSVRGAPRCFWRIILNSHLSH